ncbi:MAG: hypothetical protein ACRCW2_04100 [Cellulosilyticaceae bacterium]
MLINKTANVQTAAVGDQVTFTLQVINNDAFPINNVQITDVIPRELQFVTGSLKVNGQSRQGDIGTSIIIGTLDAGAMASIRFDVTVLNQGDGTVVNVATGTYSYQAPGMLAPEFATVSSQDFVLVVIDPTISVTKVASQTAVGLGDVFYFTLTLEHLGDVTLSNVIVQDVLNAAFSLVPGTLTVNSQVVMDPDLARGIVIPNLQGGSAAIISFAVKVNGGSSTGCITNVANVTGTFVYPNGTLATKTWKSNPVRIYVGVTNFKQITLDATFNVPLQKPDMEDISGVTATIDILDSYVIPTASGVSNEGQILTGNKLVVNGVIKIIMTYTALTATQDMYAVYCEIPFGTFIVLPIDYKPGYRVEPIAIVEKASYSMEDARKFYVNTAILIKAAVLI